MDSILADYIRPVTEEDKKLLEFSHSRLECFSNCPYQYHLKYNENKTSIDTTIALEFGTLAHLVLEHKGKMITEQGKVDYDFLNNMLEEGGMSDDGKGNEFHVLGIKELKKKYFDTWGVADSEGRNYNDKVKNFLDVMHTEMEEDDGWTPTYFEYPFNYVYKDKIILHGFIDRIDTRVNQNGETEYRVVDYKTSKKVYDTTKTATSQQFAIYNMAILNEFNTLAVENLYRFICINDSQNALTIGWEKRFIKKLDKILEQIDKGYEEKLWSPKATPLCYWCSYCRNNPDATTYRRECEYFSLWTPTNKTFEKNKEFDPTKKDEPRRRLSF